MDRDRDRDRRRRRHSPKSSDSEEERSRRDDRKHHSDKRRDREDHRRRRSPKEEDSRDRGRGERPRHDGRDKRHDRDSFREPPRRPRRSPSPRRRKEEEKEHEWGKQSSENNKNDPKKPQENNAKPNFALSGKLTEETNMFNGVLIKYSEPPEARIPKRRWRLYPFKGEEGLPTLYIHRQSAYLIGRDRKVADFPVDHPSCSKQHAAFQYRLVPYTRPDGTKSQRIRLYIIDLESANGTYINNNKIEPRKYVELFEKDVIKFGYSSREYVLLHEHSQEDDEDDNVIEDGDN